MSSAASVFLPYLFRYRFRFAIGALFLVGATGLQLLSPWVLKLAIDHLTASLGQGAASLAAPVGGMSLGAYAGLLVALALAAGVCRFLMRRIIIGVSREVEFDLRNDFFSHLQRLPPAWFHAQRTGDLMSRATNDLSAVRMMAGPAVMYSATTSITFVVAVLLMISISPGLTLVVLLPLPIVSVAVKWFGSAIYRRSEAVQAQLAAMSAVAQEALAGVRVVRAYRRESVEVARFRGANHEYLDRSRRLVELQGAFHPTLALFLGLSSLLALWFGSGCVIEGRMSLGDFVAFNVYVTMLAWPVIAFGWVTNMLQRGMAAWRRMLDILEVAPAIRDPERPVALDAIRGTVEFRNLTFAYGPESARRGSRPVLTNVSARVEPGQVLALVGPTGSGKSTLVELLPRLFDPPAGTVFVDGVDVRDLPLDRLRGAIGYVPQEPLLFSETVAGNVAFGARTDPGDYGDVDGQPSARAAIGPETPNGTLARAMAGALALARLDGDIASFPKGLETEVGERGITLSGGQKQRAALARALLTDPRILILDDALSAVDTHTEEAILSRLRSVMRERTTILVSHRISTVRDADLILVLDDGRVVERGAHDDLVAAGGLYAGLHEKQLLETALEES